MKQVFPGYDVVIIGLGPTGLVLANLLGRRGWSVVGFERDADVYYAPRAVHFDDEIMRVFQELGLQEEMRQSCEPFKYMEIKLKPGGKSIFRTKVGVQDRRHGYEGAWWFHQPTLERHLRAAVERHPTVFPYFGASVTDVSQDEDGVAVTATMPDGETRTVRARFAIGCDGGRSFTRKAAGLVLDSEEFDEAWVVVDAKTKTGEKDPTLPTNHYQCCNPRQPVTYVPLAGPYYEWQFMVVDDKSEREATDPILVRRQLRAFVDLEKIEIMRIAYYRFHALWGQRWRNRRIILAGDSAHQMPPFLGQGMCSGIRDAQSLAWRLDLALKGCEYATLLDDYERERCEHVRHIIRGAMFLGNTIQTRSRLKAILRNNLLLRPCSAVPILNKLFMWVANRKRPIENGFFGQNRKRVVGRLFPQPVVTRSDGPPILLDELLGQGFAVVARRGAIVSLPIEVRDMAEQLSIRMVRFAASSDPGVVGDGSGALETWFEKADADFAIVRPDHYVYDAGRAEEFAGILQAFLTSIPAMQHAEVVA